VYGLYEFDTSDFTDFPDFSFRLRRSSLLPLESPFGGDLLGPSLVLPLESPRDDLESLGGDPLESFSKSPLESLFGEDFLASLESLSRGLSLGGPLISLRLSLGGPLKS